MLQHKLSLFFISSTEREKFMFDLFQFSEGNSEKAEWISLMDFSIKDIFVDPRGTKLLHLEFTSSKRMEIYSFKRVIDLYGYIRHQGSGKSSISHLIYCQNTSFDRCRMMISNNYANKIMVRAWGFNNHPLSSNCKRKGYKSFYHTLLSSDKTALFSDIIFMLRISDIKFPKSEKIRNANSNVDINENISHDQIQTQNEDRYDYEYDEED